jgi:hypothetical protein
MDQKAYIRIYEPEGGLPYGDFSLFLPAGALYAEYRFVYEQNPPKPELPFNKGPNDPANRSFYRIKTAWIVRQDGEWFVPQFRALQSGEIGLALREQGAGDFVGGLHGDENLTAVSLWLGDRELPLDQPFFGCADGFRFLQSSKINRCNTPDMLLALHDQTYTLDGVYYIDGDQFYIGLGWEADLNPFSYQHNGGTLILQGDITGLGQEITNLSHVSE